MGRYGKSSYRRLLTRLLNHYFLSQSRNEVYGGLDLNLLKEPLFMKQLKEIRTILDVSCKCGCNKRKIYLSKRN